MLTIPVSIETLPPIRRGVRELVSLSHRLSLARHYNDGTRRKNVTDGRTSMAGCAIRGRASQPGAVAY